MSPATKMKFFLLSISAGCTYSFSLQETYTFQLHFVLHWRAQSDCPRSVSLSMTFSTPYTTAVIVPLLAVVCLEIAWFCFFRPAGLCPVWKKLFSVSRGEIPELSCKFFEEAQNIHRKLRYSNDRPGGGGLPAPRRLLPRAARGAPVGAVRPAGGCWCDRAPLAALSQRG